MQLKDLKLPTLESLQCFRQGGPPPPLEPPGGPMSNLSERSAKKLVEIASVFFLLLYLLGFLALRSLKLDIGPRGVQGGPKVPLVSTAITTITGTPDINSSEP